MNVNIIRTSIFTIFWLFILLGIIITISIIDTDNVV